MDPVRELRAALARPRPVRGVVVTADASRVRVATPQGLQLAVASGTLRPGDLVRLSDGIAYRRATASRRYVI